MKKLNSQNQEVYADISVIIGMMPQEMRNKISNQFIDFIETHKDQNYISTVNPTIPLKDQDIKEEVRIILGIIYRDYLCSEQEKSRLLEEDKKQLEKVEEEKRKKYNPENIFKEHKEIVEKTQQLIVVKEKNIFQKIIEKLKKLVQKNN